MAQSTDVTGSLEGYFFVVQSIELGHVSPPMLLWAKEFIQCALLDSTCHLLGLFVRPELVGTNT